MYKIVLLAAAAAVTTGTGSEGPVTNDRIAPARDGNIAIEEELCAARKARTIAAYDLFLARHPGHPLAEVARRERAQLAASPQR